MGGARLVPWHSRGPCEPWGARDFRTGEVSAPAEEELLSENEFLKKPWRTLSATIGDRDEPGETWIWDDFAWPWS